MKKYLTEDEEEKKEEEDGAAVEVTTTKKPLTDRSLAKKGIPEERGRSRDFSFCFWKGDRIGLLREDPEEMRNQQAVEILTRGRTDLQGRLCRGTRRGISAAPSAGLCRARPSSARPSFRRPLRSLTSTPRPWKAPGSTSSPRLRLTPWVSAPLSLLPGPPPMPSSFPTPARLGAHCEVPSRPHRSPLRPSPAIADFPDFRVLDDLVQPKAI